MLVLLHGIPVDSSIEQNIETKKKFGFNVFMLFKKGSYQDAYGKQVAHIWHNITQVHINYVPEDEIDNKDIFGKQKVACESDILRGGGWRLAEAIEVIIIGFDIKIHTEYCTASFNENNGVQNLITEYNKCRSQS